ncbi:hypothetical protein HBB16_18040 [Pseudonocardia sp. MCCB 268]|nr:hypothetical protein [Pseudonocardia cytotoxica]
MLSILFVVVCLTLVIRNWNEAYLHRCHRRHHRRCYRCRVSAALPLRSVLSLLGAALLPRVGAVAAVEGRCGRCCRSRPCWQRCRCCRCSRRRSRRGPVLSCGPDRGGRPCQHRRRPALSSLLQPPSPPSSWPWCRVAVGVGGKSPRVGGRWGRRASVAGRAWW